MEPAAGQSPVAYGRRIIRAMLVIVFFGLFLKFGGFLMYWLMNAYYGKGPVLDAFTAVYGTVIMLFFYSSMLKVVVPAFMPLFAERMHNKGEDAAWELANTVMTLALLVGVVGGVLVCAFARGLVSLLLPKFTAEAQAASVTLLRWMTPGVVVLFFAIVALGILNSYKVFSYPSAAEAAQKSVWAVGLFTAISLLGISRAPEHAPHIIGAAFLIGCAAQATVLLAGLGSRLKQIRLGFPALSRRRLIEETAWLACCAGAVLLGGGVLQWMISLPEGARLHLDRENASFLAINGLTAVGGIYVASLWMRSRGRTGIMGRFAFLAAPLIVGVLFARYRDLAFASFQSYTAEGQFGIIELAKRAAGLPGVLVAYSLAIAMFPYLCDMAARKETDSLGRVVGASLRFLAVALIPLTATTMVLSGPIMQLLFDRGTWGPEDVRSAGLALALLATGIYFVAIENVLMQSFFSLQRTVLPTVLGIVFSILPSVALYVLIKLLRLEAWAFALVCLAFPVSRAMKNACLLAVVHRSARLMTSRDFVGFLVKLGTLTAGPALAAWGLHSAIAAAMPLSDYRGGTLIFEAVKCAHVGLPAAAALAVFVLTGIILRLEEFGMVAQWVRERGWKVRSKVETGTDG